MPDVIDPPAPEPVVDPFANLDFDPAALDPINLIAPGDKKEPEQKKEEPEPQKIEDKKEPVVEPPKEDHPLDPRSLKDPKEPKESLNFKQLRELRKQAEEERDRYKAEVEAKNKELEKLAALEEKSSTYQREQELLRQQLKEREEKTEVLQATLRRTAARETPEWKQTATAIHSAVAEVGKILALPEVKEAGLAHQSLSLLDPTNTGPLNEVLQVLQENKKFAEANILWKAHESVNVWRGQLRDIETKQVEEAKKWSEERSSKLTGLFEEVRRAISKVNPSLDPNSEAFKGMPQESRDFVMAQYKEAATEAQQVVDMADRPDVLAAGAYHNALVQRLQAHALKGSQTQVAEMQAELSSLKEKLAAYEKAAGGAVSGGSTNKAPIDMDDLEELAKSLDPRNMPGYRGLNAGV